jgi:23S rRNA (guanosine2251-2'-O)-methyltransferase
VSRLVLGVQPIREVLRAHGSKTERVLVEHGDSPQLAALLRMAEHAGVKTERVPRAMLEKLAGPTRHQGCAAYAPPLRLLSLDELGDTPDMLVVALDEIQDPQNFGAIVRSCVALGEAAVLWPQNASAPLTPATFRASAGAIEHARLVRVPSLRTALSELHSRAARIVGLDGTTESVALSSVDMTGPTVLIVGSEGKGLRKSVRSIATDVAAIPMSGVLDSLNASVATAIALYEVTRQRNNNKQLRSYCSISPKHPIEGCEALNARLAFRGVRSIEWIHPRARRPLPKATTFRGVRA